MLGTIRKRLRSEKGFTLIELLVVMIILAILTAIAIPSYLSFKDRANNSAAAADVRSIIPSIESYFSDNGTYASMTVAGLQASYDQAINLSMYSARRRHPDVPRRTASRRRRRTRPPPRRDRPRRSSSAEPARKTRQHLHHARARETAPSSFLKGWHADADDQHREAYVRSRAGRHRRRQLRPPHGRRLATLDAGALSRRVHLCVDRPVPRGVRPSADSRRPRALPGPAPADRDFTRLADRRRRCRLSARPVDRRARDVPCGRPGVPARPAARG